MGLDFASILSPWILFGAASFIVVVVIVVLTIVEKVLDKKIAKRREEEDSFFREKIEYLRVRESKPEEFLAYFNNLVLEVFKEALGLEKIPDYDEVSGIFRQKENLRAAKFAERVQRILYSGEEIDTRKLDSLLTELIEIINEFRGINKKQTEPGMTERFEKYAETFFERIGLLRADFDKFEKIKRRVDGESVQNSEEKTESEEKAEEPVPEVRKLKVVPLAREKIVHRKVIPTKRKIERHRMIGSIDDMGRLKEKLKKRGVRVFS